jgi:hypothetical protein
MTIFEEIEPASSIDQGDVFAQVYFPAIDNYANALVITPTCDIVQGKAQFIKFLSTVSSDFVVRIMADSVDVDDSYLSPGKPLTMRKLDTLIKVLRRNTTGDFLPRYYFLPEFPGILKSCYLDLQRTFAVSYKQVIEEYMNQRIARVLSPWREQILSSYASYSMRVGTPDYPDDDFKILLANVGFTLPQ